MILPRTWVEKMLNDSIESGVHEVQTYVVDGGRQMVEGRREEGSDRTMGGVS